MNICVTGGAGFIGSHLVDALIEQGHQVLVIDNLSTGCREFVNPRADFFEMDICTGDMQSLFTNYHIDYVFHEAAQTMVPVSMENPILDCEVNLKGLLRVLEACRHSGVRKIIMPSSAAVYGDCTELPLTEEMKGNTSSFYGLTKLTTEEYLRLYRDAYGLPYICFRYANVYGPRQGNGGEGGVISILAQKMVQEEPFTIFGDGTQTRDFVYVADVVEANLKALAKETVNGVFNVSTNRETSLNELTAFFSEIAKRDLNCHYGPERAGDIKRSRLDNRKSKKELGWQAETDLQSGLTKTYEYIKIQAGR